MQREKVGWPDAGTSRWTGIQGRDAGAYGSNSNARILEAAHMPSFFERLSAMALILLLPPAVGHAITVKISAEALERTLRNQLFTAADARYYIKGDASAPCFVYAEQPRVSFKDDRVVVHVHARARLGPSIRGTCLGVSLTTDADVSFIPEAEGETIGFHDARIEKLSDSRELNFLLTPFLSRKLPSQMKVNAADLIRSALKSSPASTGYAITLDTLKLHSMQVDHTAVTIDADAGLGIN